MRFDGRPVHREIGARLRALRRERGVSLADVSRATGISSSFLSLIENGKNDITITRLIRLVEFYDIHITNIIDQELGNVDRIVVRRGDEACITSDAEGIELFLLAPDTDRTMMPMLAVYQPGGEVAERLIHSGEEFVTVVKGEIELAIDGYPPLHLREGDSAYYDPKKPHSVRNLSSQPTKLFLVCTPPTM